MFKEALARQQQMMKAATLTMSGQSLSTEGKKKLKNRINKERVGRSSDGASSEGRGTRSNSKERASAKKRAMKENR